MMTAHGIMTVKKIVKSRINWRVPLSRTKRMNVFAISGSAAPTADTVNTTKKYGSTSGMAVRYMMPAHGAIAT